MNKQTYFVFADPHGEFTVLQNELKLVGFDEHNENHILLGLGDYFDRGSENVQMFRFLNDMRLKKRAILINGNHDDMLLDFLNGEDVSFHVVQNGLDKTLNQLSGKNMGKNILILDQDALRDEILTMNKGIKGFLKSLVDEVVIDNFILTHGGFTQNEDGDWHVDNWANTENFVLNYKDNQDFTFVFGHWHGYRLNATMGIKPNEKHFAFLYKNFIGLDAMTNLTKKMNIFVITTGEENG